MTINKSQGQSLNNVGLYLPKLVFLMNNFMLWYQESQTRMARKLFHDKEKQHSNLTNNVVYKEIFENI